MKPDYALISTPLSVGFRGRLEATLQSSPTYLPLAELRRLPTTALVRKLLTLDAERLIIPVEDQDSFGFVPAALALASMANARQIVIVKPDLACEPISRLRASKRLADTVGASATGALAWLQSRRQVAQLLATPRLKLPPPPVGRVLYLRTNMSFGLRAGGSVGHVAGVINGLSRTGFPVDVAAIDRPAMLDPDVRVRPLAPLAAFGFPYETNLHRFNQSVTRQALQLTESERYTFIYQRLSIASYAGATLSRRARLPLVVEYNGSEAWVAQNWAVPLRDQQLAVDAERALLQHATVVVTVSDVLRRELEQNGVDKGRIVMYPNCVDPRVYDPARFAAEPLRQLRARLGIAPDALVAAFVGTFGQWHGVDVLARTIVRMVKEAPGRLAASRLHFLFVGDGLLMPMVRELLADPAVAARCTLCGLVPQAETPAHIAISDILLSPHVDNADGSRFFGSPTKLFEYMALGKPIIASDLEQIGQVLRNSVHIAALPASEPAADESRLALLCRPNREDELAEALYFLAGEPAWRATLGANGRSEALARYTWDRHVAAVTDRLRDV